MHSDLASLTKLEEALTTLNDQQRAAVEYVDSPLLILAGAGSGKTRVITVKIAHLVLAGHIDPRDILAVTFTNKAAREMRERVADFLGPAHGVMIRTFHSFGAWMLRSYGSHIGLTPEFSIYDDADSELLLRSLFPEHARSNIKRWARVISRAKDKHLDPSDDLSELTEDSEVSAIYQQYQTELARIGNVDFGDLILKPIRLFKQGEALRKNLQNKFKVILVDEYQDSNTAQFHMLQELYMPEKIFCVVGDDDQSIYRFRGAELRNILQFSQAFPRTKIIQLEQNYRSTLPILNFASAAVAHNSGRYGKKLFSTRQEGSKPVVIFLEDHIAEAEFCSRVVNMHEGSIAILYRTNAQSRSIETVLNREGIPYSMVGSLKFWMREEVKDVIALLMLTVNPRDEVAFTRIIRKPPRGIGLKTIERILQETRNSNTNILESMEQLKLNEKAQHFFKLIRRMRKEIETEAALASVVMQGVEESGLFRYYQERDEEDAKNRVENIEELMNAIAEYGSGLSAVVNFLETVELDRESKNTQATSVTLLTMHSTKGLEFDHVIVTGLEDECFPGFRDPDDVEEERRLFYVAATRAKDTLYLTSCARRYIRARMEHLNVSRFLDEIPSPLYEVKLERFARHEEETLLWNPGQKVTHEEYGAGIVTNCARQGAELLLTVKFENGMKGEFLPRYASRLRKRDY